MGVVTCFKIVFLEVLSGDPSSLFESILLRLPLRRLSRHSLRAGIMLLPLVAADLEDLFLFCVCSCSFCSKLR